MANPRISVFTTVKNGARFVVETIESIRKQKFKDYEIVIVDGASTDGTVDLLRRYPEIRWISEPDRSAEEGFHKALALCRGDYLIQCCISDGFVDSDWFGTCVGILDSDPEISLVYGIQENRSEDGGRIGLTYHELLRTPPPQKRDFFTFWLATRFHYPEPNYCIRREVMLRCFPCPDSEDFFDRKNPFLKTVLNLNTQGYLPFFVPTVANYYKTHAGQQSETRDAEGRETARLYHQMAALYGRQVLTGELLHRFRDGRGAVIGEIGTAELPGVRQQIQKHVKERKTYVWETRQAVFSILEDLSPRQRFLLLAHARFNDLLSRVATRLER